MTSQYLRSRFSSLREYLTPINHQSNFETTGEISPEEFVKAGDYLVYRFPTWQWSPADPSKTKDFLPREKQFLVTRHVPSYVRASDYEKLPAEDVNMGDIETVEGEDGEGWTKTNTKPVLSRANSQLDESSIKEISSDDEADLQDIDELIDENAEDIDFLDNKKTLEGEETACQITNKRNYDLYITYSTSYRVPKMYLVGFDNDSVPLTPEQMFEDIASDYRFKTVTIEKAPFLSNTTSVSIHPCKHANVMKVLMKHAKMAAIERLNKEKSDRVLKKISKLGLNEEDNDNKGLEEEWEDVQTNEENDKEESETEGIRVDQYLVVFLKFISSVTPGIEHDYTMEAL